MDNKNIQILCFGETLWDHLPTGSQAGGAPMNVAIHLHKLGVNVDLVSRVGNDELGKQLINFLKSSGLLIDFIQIDEKMQTSEVLVHLDKNKNASYNIIKPVAWDNIEINNSLHHLASEVSCIVYGSLAARSKKSFLTLQQIINSKALKVMDVNLRPPHVDNKVLDALLKQADIIKMNEEELSILSKGSNEKDRIEWIANTYTSKVVIITKGKNGTIAFANEEFYYHRGFVINVMDTVGAGDAFLAGFLSKYLCDKNILNALSFGNALGAFVASQEGATPEYKLMDILKIQS